MIKKTRFKEIDDEVKGSIIQLFNKLKGNTENYVLFLAKGEFVEKWMNANMNPYSIENAIDWYKDETRLNFLILFLRNYYSFSNGQKSTDNNEYRMNLELMVYTHIWESVPFLKDLYRIAHLLNGEKYAWKVQVPDMSKQSFIRTEIREVLEKLNLNLGDVIKKGFHSSLRNAFAHSDYSFVTMNDFNRIDLYNYKGSEWELESISFDDWSERFVYSALLSFYLMKIFHDCKRTIKDDLNQIVFSISHPDKNGLLKQINIEYSEDKNRFFFKR